MSDVDTLVSTLGNNQSTVLRVVELGHAILLPAIRAAIAGATVDDSLMIIAERAADARAAEKFSGFKP